MSEPMSTECSAARTGQGYWTCDVPGGCPDCRTLAVEINDAEQLSVWGEEVAAIQPDLLGAFEEVTGLRPDWDREVSATFSEADDRRIEVAKDRRDEREGR